MTFHSKAKSINGRRSHFSCCVVENSLSFNRPVKFAMSIMAPIVHIMMSLMTIIFCVGFGTIVALDDNLETGTSTSGSGKLILYAIPSV